jgi:L-alanine-DL-glutamate epimerase-like enolase superfamily enzyme
MIFEISHRCWPMKYNMRFAGGSYAAIDTITVQIAHDGIVGRGECRPHRQLGETVDTTTRQLLSMEGAIKAGITSEELMTVMPAGAARSAIDSALLDLMAKQSNRTIWSYFGISECKVLETYLTLGTCGTQLPTSAQKPGMIKVKIDGENGVADVERMRKEFPNSTIIVDANGSLDAESYMRIVDSFVNLNVILIEQPFSAAREYLLERLPRPIAVCADESVYEIASLHRTLGMYDAVNIKIGKCGGLTAALAMQLEAKKLGIATMSGCVVSTSLSIAPAMIIGQRADYVDLDGPLFLKEDRENGIIYDGNRLRPFVPALWG